MCSVITKNLGPVVFSQYYKDYFCPTGGISGHFSQGQLSFEILNIYQMYINAADVRLSCWSKLTK